MGKGKKMQAMIKNDRREFGNGGDSESDIPKGINV